MKTCGMRKKRAQQEKKAIAVIKKTTIKGILPFPGQPSQEGSSTDSAAANHRLPASDLFSFFTADIIKEKKLFTR